MKKDDVLIFLVLSFVFGNTFGSKNDTYFCPVFAFHRSMSNTICDLKLYLQSDYLKISLIYPDTIPFQHWKTVFAIQYLTLLIAGSQSIFLKCKGSIWDLGSKYKQKQILYCIVLVNGIARKWYSNLP